MAYTPNHSTEIAFTKIAKSLEQLFVLSFWLQVNAYSAVNNPKCWFFLICKPVVFLIPIWSLYFAIFLVPLLTSVVIPWGSVLGFYIFSLYFLTTLQPYLLPWFGLVFVNLYVFDFQMYTISLNFLQSSWSMYQTISWINRIAL